MHIRPLCIFVMVALMITVFAGLGTAQSLTLQLTSGTAVRTIPDNGCDPVIATACDQDSTVGNIRFVGPVGSYNTNISVGKSIPALIDLGSTDSSRSSGTLTITLAQKGVNVPAAPQTLTTSLSGSFSGPASSSFSINFLAGANAGNASPLDNSIPSDNPAVIPSGSVCVGDVAGGPSCTTPLGPFTTSGFNGGGTQTFTTSGGPFSIFNQANITVNGCTSVSPCRVNLNHSTAVMGYVTVTKTENGSSTLSPPQGSGYVFQLRQGASATAAGTTLESQEAYAGNPMLVFTSQLTPGVTYNMCELLKVNVLNVVWSISTPYNPGLDDTTMCVDFTAQGGTTVVIGVDNQLPAPKTVAGNIIVKKVTIPSGSSQSFTFSPGYGTPFNLSDGQSNKSAPLNPATYSVSETPSSGWDLTSATCDNGNSPSAITLTGGQTVTCTFTNTQRGHIIVNNVTNPSGSSQSFAFAATWGSFNLAGSGSSDSGPIVPGTYSVSESAVTGWDQNGATCDNGSALNAISLPAGQTVTCTFTNTQRGHIVVKNVTNPSSSSQSFGFAASWGSFNLTNGGSSDSGPIVPGTYSVSETAVVGWDLTSTTCDNGNANASAITLTAGQTVTCTFTNTQRGHIIVKQVTNPSGSTQSFAFTAGWGSFSLTDGGSSDSGPIVPGSYQVSDPPLTSWDLTSATCDNGGSPSSITLAAGQTVTCTFTNTQRGHIIVNAVTNPSGASQSFAFASTWGSFSLTGGGSNDSGPVKPGNYNVSETAPSGWTLTSAVCNGQNNAPGSINLAPGQTVTCTFTNVAAPPAVGPVAGPTAPQAAGTSVTITAAFTDKWLNQHTCQITWGDGTVNAGLVTESTATTAGSCAGSHAYTATGVYSAIVTVSSAVGSGSAASASFTVDTPPTVGPVTAPPAPQAIGTSVTVAASFADQFLFAHTCTLAWGDGAVTTITASSGSLTESTATAAGSCSASHVYASSAVYSVLATVTNAVGSGSASSASFPIFDPYGSIKGNPRIWSLPFGGGSTTQVKASLAFSAKPDNNNIPKGNLEFKVGKVKVKSISYSSLVVVSSNLTATLTGSATVRMHTATHTGDDDCNIESHFTDAKGTYSFRLDAMDGGTNDGANDAIRFQVWQMDSSPATPVYDTDPPATTGQLSPVIAGKVEIKN